MQDVIINICPPWGGQCPPKPNLPSFVFFHEGKDRPMKGKTVMVVTLSKAIKPGWQRLCSVATDEAVDIQQPSGLYARSEMVQGDSTAPIVTPESTATKINFWVNGDGAMGVKKANVICDGHIGEGDVPITLEVNYEVKTPDATSFENFQEGEDREIPT